MVESESANLGIESLGQIHISVTDLDRAIEFYEGTLGLQLLFRVPGQPMAFFDCGGVRLYLGVPESDRFRSSPVLYYRVADIEAACDRLRSAGVELEAEPHLTHRDERHELWLAGLRDPDGNAVCLMCEKPLSA